MLYTFQQGQFGRRIKLASNDPYYANVVSLLHANGVSGEQTYTDEKGKVWGFNNTRSWSFNGNAQLDTAQQKYGTASLLLDGTGDFLSTTDSADLEFGAGDWTVEAAIRLNSTSGVQDIATHYEASGSQRAWIWYVNGGTSLRFLYSLNGSTNNDIGGSFTFSTGVWYQVAVARVGTTIYLFVDGTLVGSNSGIGSSTIFNSTAPVVIGAQSVNSTAANFFNGWVDEFRLTVGVGRYTATYTPPSAEFLHSTSADASYASVKSLLHFNGADAATSTSDSAFTPGINTTLASVGTGCIELANSNYPADPGPGWLSTPSHADFSFAAGDFTIEAMVRFNGFGTTQDIFGTYQAQLNAWRRYILYVSTAGKLGFLYSTDGTATSSFEGTTVLSATTWYKVAASRVGSTIYLFIDGVLETSNSGIGASSIYTGGSPKTYLGGQQSTGECDSRLRGHIDEVRITKGVGRYTANYTPVSPFPDS